MSDAGVLTGAARRCVLALAVTFGLLLLAGSVAIAQAEAAKVLMYSGTTGYRHSGGDEAIQPDVVAAIQDALDGAGIESDHITCNGTGTGAGDGNPSNLTGLPGCRNATIGNPATFAEQNLAQYDAIFFWQASSNFRNQPGTGPLFTLAQSQAIEAFVNDGGGIAAMHAPMTMGAGAVTQVQGPSGNQPWTWWDGADDSAIGALMPGHSATDINNVARVEVSDRNHPSTKDLPDTYEFGDEHYTFDRNVRGTHHVLMTLDESSYNLGQGVTSMGADHPVAWCRLYDGGRFWGSGLGHFAASFRENGFDNNLMTHLVGGVAWVAGVQGGQGDCGGTVWSNFNRTVLETGIQAAIGLDVAADGKAYWTEIGLQGVNSEGRVRYWDPDTEETETLVTIPTRAEYQSSNAGVLGMVLDPDFDQNRHFYVYYSPRVTEEASNCVPAQANCVANNSWIGWHNVVSRFTLNAAGDAVVADSEQEILRVRRIAVGNNNQDGTGVNAYSAHQGGAGLSFDSEGNLYLGTGDDVDPFGDSGNYAPIDQRFPERYDARTTSANTNDLRGKVLRIAPLENASGEAGVGSTYEIPDGNLFSPGTEDTLPEIYAMGFRNPFTLHADPERPGHVVVGEYAPDAAQDNPTRGPAAVLEWNHISEPGFYGWPMCVGDNSTANTYNRYQFPSGPSGAKWDCQAEAIPNESPFNTGLDDIPGPTLGAEVWAKAGGGHPSQFGIPPITSEANTAPVYRYDPELDSETKWPAYYDGSWLIYNRGVNWWREARMTDDGSELLTVNGFFQTGTLGSPAHNHIIPTRFGPDGALYLITWSGGCCRAGLPGLGQGSLMRIDHVGEQPDTIPPVPSHSLSGNQDGDGAYVGLARLTLTATDQGGSGVDKIEYSVNGGPWNEYGGTPIPFDEPGDYVVAYRATDRAENVSDVFEVEFTVVPGECVGPRSDEFDGAELDSKWQLVRSDPGQDEPSVSGGNLILPLGAFSVDLDRPGPITMLGQELPDEDFTVEAKIEAPGLGNDDTGQGSVFAQVGFKLFQGNDDWVKVVQTRQPGTPGDTYFEMAYENGGSRTLGPQMEQAPTRSPFWLQITRTGDAVTGAYATQDPDQGGTWNDLGNPANLATIFNPADGPVHIGPYGGNGSIDASYEYVRFEPDDDECDENGPPVIDSISADPSSGTAPLDVDFSVEASDPDGDDLTYEWDFGDGGTSSEEDPSHTYTEAGDYEAEVTVSDGQAEVSESVTVTVMETEPDLDPPVTTVMLNGAAPQPFYDGDVTATFTATDPGPDPSGVDFTEFRVDSDDEADWETYNPVSPPQVAAEGEHTIDYRSHDNAGNEEEAKTVTFTIDSDGGGEANLRVVGQPKKRTVGPKKKQTSFRLRATNRGDAPSGTVHLCATAPKKRVKVLGQRCRTFENIDPGQTRQRPVKLRIKPKARGTLTKIKLIARGPDVEKRQATVRLQVRR